MLTREKDCNPQDNQHCTILQFPQQYQYCHNNCGNIFYSEPWVFLSYLAGTGLPSDLKHCCPLVCIPGPQLESPSILQLVHPVKYQL